MTPGIAGLLDSLMGTSVGDGLFAPSPLAAGGMALFNSRHIYPLRMYMTTPT